jgi:hypothetical protein
VFLHDLAATSESNADVIRAGPRHSAGKPHETIREAEAIQTITQIQRSSYDLLVARTAAGF